MGGGEGMSHLILGLAEGFYRLYNVYILDWHLVLQPPVDPTSSILSANLLPLPPHPPNGASVQYFVFCRQNHHSIELTRGPPEFSTFVYSGSSQWGGGG